nr:reverse transcriptase domain-containing protein [Tanacetum cinerariifolium]
SRADPPLLNEFEMANEGNGDLPVPDLRTMEELFQPSLNGRGGPIVPIAIQATNFGLKNDMIQQGSGTLPGNTITNSKEELKGITTRSGTAYQGPTIPITSSLPPVVKRETEATNDTVHPTNNGSTKDVQPPVVQTESPTLNALEYDPTSPKVDQSYVDTEGDILLLKAFLYDVPSLPPPNQGNYLPQVCKELKICEAKTDKSSIDEPLEVELKDLPPHLEYAFW